MKLNSRLWQSAEKLFHELADLPDEKKSESLKKIEQTDPVTFQLLEILLREEENPHPLLDQQPQDILNKLYDDKQLIGNRIGSFVLHKLLGRGAMGSVFLALRDDGQFNQQVAIKLMRPGAYKEEVLKLFVDERQILAKLQHPNIAHLYDGGMTDDGRPYFVMEYVEGISITEYCIQKKLTDTDKLQLFRKVCDAIIFAHQSLVAHLDLKPDNILVDKTGKVKVLDFGISRFLQHYTSQVTNESNAPNRYTLAYAAPEQLKNEKISASTDIYSLGTLLYQLLTNDHPFKLFLDDFEKLHDAIISQRPQFFKKKTKHLPLNFFDITRNDLSIICKKAMEKIPSERYASVTLLDEDIQSYLQGFPISLKKNKKFYVASKLIQRNSRLTVAVVLAILIIISTSSYYTSKIAKERDQAIKEATRSTEIVNLLSDVFQSADPNEANGENITAVQLLNRGLLKVDKNLKRQPDLFASILLQIGSVYQNLGQYEKADSLINLAYKINTALFFPPHEILANNLIHLASISNMRGNSSKAIEYANKALAYYEKSGIKNNKQVVEAMYELGNSYYFIGNFIKSDSINKSIYAINKKLYKAPHPQLAEDLHNLGTGLRKLSLYNEAEKYLLEALDMKRKLYKEPHSEIAFTLNHLGSLYQNKGDWEGSIPFIEESLRQRKVIFGDVHIETIASKSNLARAYKEVNRLDEAEKIYKESLANIFEIFGTKHPYFAALSQSLAAVYVQQGRYDQADSLFRSTSELETELLDSNDVKRTFLMMNWADLLMKTSKYQNALPILQTALRIRQTMLPANHEMIGATQYAIGKCLFLKKDYVESIVWFDSAYQILNNYKEKYADDLKLILNHLEFACTEAGQTDKATRYRALASGVDEASP